MANKSDFLVVSKDNELFFVNSTTSLLKPTIIIQPYLDILVFVGESDEAWRKKAMLESVCDTSIYPENLIVAVPLGLGTPYGVSAGQAEYIINHMMNDMNTHFVSRFFKHLCLDNDIRIWINEEMIRNPQEKSNVG